MSVSNRVICILLLFVILFSAISCAAFSVHAAEPAEKAASDAGSLSVFEWKPFDKAYYCFINDDAKKWLHVAYDVFHEHGVPLGAAVIADNIPLMNDTETSGNRTIKETLDLIVADGGEVLTHYAGNLLATDSYETWYNKVIRDGKNVIESYGFTTRGLILADRSNRNTEIGETICEEFFDYADAVGTKKQYQINRKQFSETSTIEDVKTYIDNTVSSPGIYPIMMHGPKAEPWATANGLDEILDYLENTYPDTAQVSTYSYVFDTFGTYREITESTEPAFSGVGKDGYYYENGQVVGGKGLIKFEDNYYFVVYSGKVAKNSTRTIQPSQLNDLPFAPGNYDFGADGKMIIKNGVVDGYYYENGQVVGGKGLIKFEDNYYFVVYSGKVAKNSTRTIQPSQLNDLPFAPGNYDFGADGKMIIKNGVVDGYYYENGQVVGGKGLIKFEGDYYFVVYSGKVAVNTTKAVQPSQTNGLLDSGYYYFGEDGKLDFNH